MSLARLLRVCVAVAAAGCSTLTAGSVTVRFDPSDPGVGPFPTDYLTVPDASQKTGLRVNMPLPDCAVLATVCEDLALVNQLDGFNLQPRLRVRFSGGVNVDTLRDGIFYLWLENLTAEEFGQNAPGEIAPINQVIYDPATDTAYAKPDEFFDQHRRYAIVVTDAVRDASGNPVAPDPAFLACVEHPERDSYCARLAEAVASIAPRIAPRRVVGASVFTTMTVTSWLEQVRAQLQSASIGLQRTGGRSVFPVAELQSMTWRAQTGVNPPAFRDLTMPPFLLTNVGRLAFGSFESPDFLNEQRVIPAGPAGSAVPLPARMNRIHFHVFLPATAAPAAGYPVVIFGHGYTDSRFGGPSAVAATMAGAGFATIAINAAGHGLGPGGKLLLTDRTGAVTELPDGGRALDLDGDGLYGDAEGCAVPVGPFATVALRDCLRQTVVDLMQLVRAIRAGIDLDGDGVTDLSRGPIYYAGQSLGAIYGSILTAVEPDIQAAVLNAGGGPIADIMRYSATYRGVFQSAMKARRPWLMNRGDGFDDDYVLRYRPAKVNATPGAIEIQEYLELNEWIQASGDPAAYAPHLKSSTLPGVPIKRVMFQYGKGDRSVPNPTQTHLVRAANLRPATSYYRHDLARETAPSLNPNPHAYLAELFSIPSLTVALAAQRQMALFLASESDAVPDVNGLVRPMFGKDLFETPAFLTEDFNW